MTEEELNSQLNGILAEMETLKDENAPGSAKFGLLVTLDLLAQKFGGETNRIVTKIVFAYHRANGGSGLICEDIGPRSA